MRLFLISIFAFFLSNSMNGQGCCSGGSGSPIAGGASQGVLLDREMEIAANYQYISTNKFYKKDALSASQFDNFNSNYMYLRWAYGISKDLTMSIESGYFLNKKLIGLNKRDTTYSSGISDLIIFPHYNIYNRTTENKRTEITLGMGYKIPLGKHDDSTVVYTNPKTGKKYYTISPPAVQPTNGSHDFIFYAFLFRGYPLVKTRFFLNSFYVKKGWNSLGEKYGDYASLGLFAGKTFFNKIGITVQLKGEWTSKMQAAKDIDLLAFYNIDIAATGSRKVFIVPQISFNLKSVILYLTNEIPIYQYLNGVQVGSRHQITAGLAYRFYTAKAQ